MMGITSPVTNGSLTGTLAGQQGPNPSAVDPGTLNIPIDDPAVQMMQQLANQLAAGPTTPQPAPASPVQQFLALLASNAGAQLLHQPSAAEPGIAAVQGEANKPDQYRLEDMKRIAQSQQLRLEAKVRATDNLIKVAEAKQDWAKVVALHKQNLEDESTLENLRGHNQLLNTAAQGANSMAVTKQEGRNALAVEAARVAGQKDILNMKLGQLQSQYGLTKQQVAELDAYGQNLEKYTAGPYMAGVASGAISYDPAAGARMSDDAQAKLDARAAYIKKRDSGIVSGVSSTAPPNPYQAAYDKYTAPTK
jgi:hypothetical protein